MTDFISLSQITPPAERKKHSQSNILPMIPKILQPERQFFDISMPNHRAINIFPVEQKNLV